MHVEVTAGDPYGVGADLVATGVARAAQLGAPQRALADADPVEVAGAIRQRLTGDSSVSV